MYKLLLTLSVFFVALMSSLLHAAEITTQNLTLSYSVDQQVCDEAANMLEYDKACRQYDNVDRLNPKMCAPEDVHNINIYHSPQLAFEKVAINLYGYTYVFKSPSGDISGDTIIYLDKFNGDRHPRTIETWRVNTKTLNGILEPNLTPFSSWDDTLKFSEMLKHGGKLTDEWSPVIEIKGNYYLVERECSGLWVYGAIYACNKIIKITLKKILSDKRIIPYCQYTRKQPNQEYLLNALREADEKLNDAYQRKLRNASESDRRAIQDAQRHWLTLRNSKCQFRDKGLNNKNAWLNAATSEPERANCLITESINRTQDFLSSETEN